MSQLSMHRAGSASRVLAPGMLPFRIRVPLAKLQREKQQPQSGEAAVVDISAPDAAPLSLPEYLQQAMTSSVYDYLTPSPLTYAPGLTARLGMHVHLKREDLNPSFTFYVRGAFAKLAFLAGQAESQGGVVTTSVGSRGHAVAWAARRLGLPSTVVLPEGVPAARREPLERYGSRVLLRGTSVSEAQQAARELASAEGLSLLNAHDDPRIIAGQASAGVEILQQHAAMSRDSAHAASPFAVGATAEGDVSPLASALVPRLPREPEAIFVPVGGGSLLSGVAIAVKSLSPRTLVIGVEPDGTDVLRSSLLAGTRQVIREPGLDGIWVRQLGEEVRHATTAQTAQTPQTTMRPPDYSTTT